MFVNNILLLTFAGKDGALNDGSSKGIDDVCRDDLKVDV